MKTPMSTCLYCQNNEKLNQLMIKICDLEVSQLFFIQRAIAPWPLQCGLQ